MVVTRLPVTDEIEMAQRLFEEAMGSFLHFKVPGYVCFDSDLLPAGPRKVNRVVVTAAAKARDVDGSCTDLRDAKRRRSS